MAIACRDFRLTVKTFGDRAVTPLQRVMFIAGAVLAISIGSTVVVLLLDRLFPGARYLTIAGPLLCVGAVLVFNKIYRDWR